MKKGEYELLKDLADSWDTVRRKDLYILINNVVKDERYIDEEGKVKEPFKTFLILKLIGVSGPARSLLMLSHILRKGKAATRSDLAGYLGPKFKEGNRYVNIGQCLACLEKLGVLEKCKVRQHGKETMGFHIKELELHLSCETLEGVLHGKNSLSHLDPFRIIARKFDPKKKVRDFLGTEIEFEPLKLMIGIIKCDVNFENCCCITEKVCKEIKEGTCRDIQTVNKIVINELEKISSSAARKYLKDNPLGFILTGEGYEGMTLNDDVVNKIFDKHLSEYKIRFLSPKTRRSMINSILRKFNIGVKKTRKIAVEEVLDKINTAVFDTYGNTLNDITANPLKHIQRARLFLRSAKDKKETGEPYKAIKPLQSSLSCCLTPLYLKLGLLPAKDEISTISLTRDLVFPRTVQIAEDVVKLQTEMKPVGTELKRLLTKEKVNLNEFQKSIGCLLSNEFEQAKVDEEGRIREIDEEALIHCVDSTITFMEKFVPIVEKIIKARA